MIGHKEEFVCVNGSGRAIGDESRNSNQSLFYVEVERIERSISLVSSVVIADAKQES